ncbi:hypothetical protein BBP40_003539 [Aspergillus hancockii]|nr:hypothetical protein BBP40_003539 [Aspergillus hancockii]
MSTPKAYTRDEVAQHNHASDLWVIIDKVVYDLSEFRAEHPGGDRILRKVAGKDATNEFWESHPESVIQKYHARLQVGRVETEPPEGKKGLFSWFFG